ncbi:MAG: NMD3-related protein [archaeon]
MEFCPGCGKRSKGICKECRPQIEIRYNDIILKVCAKCKKTMVSNKWLPLTIKEAAHKLCIQKIKETGIELDLIIPDMKINPGIKKEFEIHVTKQESTAIILGTIEITICPNCAKAKNEYLEGVLQLRNASDEAIDKIKEYCDKHNIHITKVAKNKNGYDLNISDHRKIKNLGDFLQKAYGGIMKVSPQLFSRDNQTSKDIYRVNVYYEMPDYKIGEAIATGKKVYLVTGVSKDISCIDLASGKNTTLNLKNKEYTALSPIKAIVTRVHPHIEVLDPENYQSISVENEKSVSLNEKVKIIKHEGKIYLI